MSQLLSLYRLQQVDSKVKVLESQSANLKPDPEILKKLHVREQKLKMLEEKLHTLKIQLKDKELKLASHSAHRKDIEKKLYDGKTTNSKELAGFSKDAEILKGQESALEDEVLGMMDQVETQAKEIEELKHRLEKSRKQEEEDQHRLAEQRADFERQIAELNERRAKVVNEIEEIYVTRYEGLRQRKQGVAIAKMEGNACGECGADLPAEIKRRVQSLQIEICSNCGRILFSAN